MELDLIFISILYERLLPVWESWTVRGQGIIIDWRMRMMLIQLIYFRTNFGWNIRCPWLWNSVPTLPALVQRLVTVGTSLIKVQRSFQRVYLAILQDKAFLILLAETVDRIGNNCFHIFLLQIEIASWCNSYRCKIWTRLSEFKSWTILFTFHIVLIPLRMVLIQQFSIQL